MQLRRGDTSVVDAANGTKISLASQIDRFLIEIEPTEISWLRCGMERGGLSRLSIAAGQKTDSMRQAEAASFINDHGQHLMDLYQRMLSAGVRDSMLDRIVLEHLPRYFENFNFVNARRYADVEDEPLKEFGDCEHAQ